MTILHILRSEPSDQVRDIIRSMSEGNENKEIKLYEGDVDYGELVELIFSHDKVVSWW
jgi:hypothetical protein